MAKKKTESAGGSTGGGGTGAELDRKKKQAVVVIHGMGEQKPMDTLRSLVEVVWELDEGIAAPNNEPNSWWLKPDDRAGLQELRRITTEPIVSENGIGNGKRVDFFEFYWADIMQGTTFQQVSSWVNGLLFRLPSEVPKNVFIAWIMLWIAVVLIGLYLGSFVIDLLRFIFPDFVHCDVNGHSAHSLLGLPLSWLSGVGCNWLSGINNFLAIKIGIGAGTGLTIGESLTAIGHAAVLAIVGCAAFNAVRKLDRSAYLEFVPNWLRLLVTFGVMAVLLVFSAPYISGALSKIGLMPILILALVYFGHGVLTRYFGDVVRYTQVSPGNVDKRNRIRERGLKLLNSLHDSKRYDRIIVVSHSLGTIVAYDLLTLLWAERGPNPENGISESARNEMQKMDDWLAELANDKKHPFSQAKFRKMQRAISLELANGYRPEAMAEGGEIKQRRRSKANVAEGSAITTTDRPAKNWLVSDLITCGSPLTHAEFLLSEHEEGVKTLVGERILPTCPPVLERQTRQGKDRCPLSFFYKETDDESLWPHHATLFAAVRWTNLYDNHWFPAFGDVASGEVTSHFSGHIYVSKGRKTSTCRDDINAISERPVRIDWGYPFYRLVTHTGYWTWPKRKPDTPPPAHIETFRDAINLRDTEQEHAP